MNGNTYDDTNAEIKITQKEINTLVKRGEAVSYKTVMNHETLERLYPGLQNRIKIKFYEGEKTKADTSKTLAMEHSSSKSIPPFLVKKVEEIIMTRESFCAKHNISFKEFEDIDKGNRRITLGGSFPKLIKELLETGKLKVFNADGTVIDYSNSDLNKINL